MGAVVPRDATGLLLAFTIILVAPAFALVLWMPSSFRSTMALLALAFLTVLVLALALALALTQVSACLSTTLCVALIDQRTPLVWSGGQRHCRLRGDLVLAFARTHPAFHQRLRP